MAQLVEWLLKTPEIRGTNPVIYALSTVGIEKTKNKTKEASKGPLKN